MLACIPLKFMVNPHIQTAAASSASFPLHSQPECPLLLSALFLCRGVLVIATPYACGFDHFRIADEAQFRMDRCLRVLTSADTEEAAQIRDLPVFGVGHSLGALTHLLIGALTHCPLSSPCSRPPSCLLVYFWPQELGARQGLSCSAAWVWPESCVA